MSRSVNIASLSVNSPSISQLSLGVGGGGGGGGGGVCLIGA